MMTLATGKTPASSLRRGGFSLVELLTVIVIMAVVMGIVGVGISGMRSPALQTAASQVSSGMSLARQLAITRNTAAAFLIATNTNSANGMPAEPFRYWAVIYSNRNSNNWTLHKDWEKLPEGAVFLETLGSGYNPMSANPFPSGANVGSPYVPSSFTNAVAFLVKAGSGTISFAASPAIFFAGDGTASGSAVAARLADGAVNGSGQVILRNTSRYYFVETDSTTGRIRVRAPESYR